jgi:hypothetical protein
MVHLLCRRWRERQRERPLAVDVLGAACIDALSVVVTSAREAGLNLTPGVALLRQVHVATRLVELMFDDAFELAVVNVAEAQGMASHALTSCWWQSLEQLDAGARYVHTASDWIV